MAVTGAEVKIEGLAKSFGKANVWRDLTMNLPPREISVLLGPSGTGMEMVGLTGDEMKLPGEISGGMRKRAG